MECDLGSCLRRAGRRRHIMDRSSFRKWLATLVACAVSDDLASMVDRRISAREYRRRSWPYSVHRRRSISRRWFPASFASINVCLTADNFRWLGSGWLSRLLLFELVVWNSLAGPPLYSHSRDHQSCARLGGSLVRAERLSTANIQLSLCVHAAPLYLVRLV